MSDIWPLIHAERAALADDLAGMTDEQWASPSLCAGLTVREVLAHLTAGARMGTGRWLAGGPLPVRLRPAGGHAAGRAAGYGRRRDP